MEKQKCEIDILGTTYQIITNVPETELPEYADGVTDFTTRTIKIAKMVKDRDSVENLEVYKNKVIRHEIIHAFLYESGLHVNSNSSWAINEEMVDWFAFQVYKIFEAIQKTITID